MRKILEISKCYPIESLVLTDNGIVTCCALQSYLDEYSNIQAYIPNRNIIPMTQAAKYVIKYQDGEIVCQSTTAITRMSENQQTSFNFNCCLMAETINLQDNRLICYTEQGQISILNNQLRQMAEIMLPAMPRSWQPMSIMDSSILIPQNNSTLLIDLEYQTIVDRFSMPQPIQLLPFDNKLFLTLSCGNIGLYDTRTRRNIINRTVSEDCSTIKLKDGTLFLNGYGNTLKSLDIFQQKQHQIVFHDEISTFWLLNNWIALMAQNPCRLQLYSN